MSFLVQIHSNTKYLDSQSLKKTVAVSVSVSGRKEEKEGEGKMGSLAIQQLSTSLAVS
jgi:hypothetical protein